MTATIQRETVNVEEAASRLGVSYRTARAEIYRSGTVAGIPVIRVGRRVLVPARALDQLLAGTPSVVEDDRDD